MKDRISHIIRSKNLTASEFADQLGVQRSGISHLISGRNKPSIDFIMKLKETFPEYSLDWLIMGKGPITVSESYKSQNTVDNSNSRVNPIPDLFTAHVEEDLSSESLLTDTTHVEEKKQQDMSSVVSYIIMVYSDDTYKIIRPRSH